MSQTAAITPFSAQIKLPLKEKDHSKIHLVFHAALLQQYKETEVYGANFPEPPPELVEGDEVYDIENIIRHWKRG